VFDLPQATYKPLKVGILTRKTKLEEILELTKMPHEDFIWYSEVLKVTTLFLFNYHLAIEEIKRRQALPVSSGS
jgi:hypothetical protein